MNRQSGQASIWALLALMVLVMIGAALLDVYNWTSTRVWAYHAAESAAERGATTGADWTHFQFTGEWNLDETITRAEVESALQDELMARGIDLAHAAWDIRVHPTSAMVTEASWPPGGSLWGSEAQPPVGWTTNRPSVGVYLEFDAPVFLGRLAGVESPARMRVFASSSLVR